MDDGGKVQRERQAEGMRDLAGERHRFMELLQRVVRIAERPQGATERGETDHSGILTVQNGLRAVTPRVTEGHTLLQVRARLDELAEEVQGRPQGLVSH